MKRSKPWRVVSAVLFFMSVLVSQTDALQPFRKPSIATTTATTAATTTTTAAAVETPTAEESDDGKSDNSTLSAAAAAAKAKNSKLTGIPQIDYIWDPNLPRELRGYNLSNYPFYATVPVEDDITFKCEGHHDGFYASIEHKCQVYHHCVYGIRHDFLCANFTAFDQKTFICHFVSDVDCENSFKYWNRNDDLYMATTTTSTTTTTIAPPPTPRRRPLSRPSRPLRRPMNRRPLDDYYYEDVEYDDEYYEERLNRRRKQRPRQRKPAVTEYEDDYEDEKRSFGGEEQPRRTNSRDRYRTDEDILEEDYDVAHRKYDRPKTRPRSTPPATDKHRPNNRKIGSSIGERRSFGDDRAPAVADVESQEFVPRRSTGRRRIAQKRPSGPSSPDPYEEEVEGESDYDGSVVENDATVPKEKTTRKAPEEFVTPKAAAASVYARPRAPPRISRPVPINEKKKFQYPVQKASATTVSPAVPAEEEEYYEDDLEYEEPVAQPVGNPRRRVHDEDDFPPPQVPSRPRGAYQELPTARAGRKPLRSTLRKPATNKKQPLVEEKAEYDSTGSASNEQLDRHRNTGKRPINNRNRAAFASTSGTDDVDFVDDDEYEERPLKPAPRPRPNKGIRKNPKKPRPFVEEEDEPNDELEPERPIRSRPSTAIITGRRKNTAASQRRKQSTQAPPPEEAEKPDSAEDIAVEEREQEQETVNSKGPLGRPNTVRVVKRPFLPSRGGSPYLPRGLQPVGMALKPKSVHTTDSPSVLDMGSTISGVRLLEHGAPILRETGPGKNPQAPRIPYSVVVAQSRDTIPPPKVSLDELYETDYDVTLNDALNPTLKPLTSHQHHIPNRNYASAFTSSADAFIDNNAQSLLTQSNNDYQYQHSNAYQAASHPAQSRTLLSTSSQQQQQQHTGHQHQRG